MPQICFDMPLKPSTYKILSILKKKYEIYDLKMLLK